MSPLTRREFMKTFGVGLASLVIASCRLSVQKPTATKRPPRPTETAFVTCYIIAVETPTPTPIDPASLSARDQLRVCWLSFTELAARTQSGENYTAEDPWGDPLGTRLTAEHRAALDRLVTAGELSTPVADLVQEAYAAAVYHVWRSNVPITCYEPRVVDYAPTSAAQLVQQSALLAEMAAKGDLNPDTVAVVQQTIQHDLAFEALAPAEVNALYDRLIKEWEQKQTAPPQFDQVELEVTPEMETAARFIVELLRETP